MARSINGIVGDVRQGSLDQPPTPMMYVPTAQVNDGVVALNNPRCSAMGGPDEPQAARSVVTHYVTVLKSSVHPTPAASRHFCLFKNIVNYGSKKKKCHSKKEEEAFGQSSFNNTTHLHLVVSNTVK
jgi:hypothetical protein